LQQIARVVDCSLATVSYALRDDPRIRPETRMAVQKVAAQLGERTTILPDWMMSLRTRPVPEVPSRPAPTENSIRPSSPNAPRAFRSDA